MNRRELPAAIDGYGPVRPFTGVEPMPAVVTRAATRVAPYARGREKLLRDIDAAFDACAIRDGMTLSFHHHLRNVDQVTNQVLAVASRRGLKGLRIAPSSLFAVHATSNFVRELIQARGVIGSFGAGGVTGTLVEMLEAGLFRNIFDVQAFDLRAVESYRHDARHLAMSASMYANPHSRGALVEQLDAMLLGAAEVDLDLNVNVTTGSDGIILGGSGGHADTAAGARLAIVTTRLAANAGPKIVERVRCLTTPGETIDAVVTEAGVAVNPRRGDLEEHLRGAGIDVLSIEQLRSRAAALAPEPVRDDARVVAVLQYRDGRVTDVVRQARALA